MKTERDASRDSWTRVSSGKLQFSTESETPPFSTMDSFQMPSVKDQRKDAKSQARAMFDKIEAADRITQKGTTQILGLNM